MSILKRLSSTSITPGTPTIPPSPGFWVEVADPPTPPVAEKVLSRGLPFSPVGVSGSSAGASPLNGGGGISQTGGGSTSQTGGGSTSQTGGGQVYYTFTSYNGQPGSYMLTVDPNGRTQVIRV